MPDKNGISKETLLEIRQQLLHRLKLVDKKLTSIRGSAGGLTARIISRETFPELGGETTVEVFEEVSPPSLPVDRSVSGWTLAEGDDAVGCRPGDCSLRPFPPNAYDAERANREYGGRREFKPALIETLGDTRELKAALRQFYHVLWYAQFEVPDMIDAKRAALKEIKRLVGENSQP